MKRNKIIVYGQKLAPCPCISGHGCLRQRASVVTVRLTVVQNNSWLVSLSHTKKSLKSAVSVLPLGAKVTRHCTWPVVQIRERHNKPVVMRALGRAVHDLQHSRSGLVL